MCLVDTTGGRVALSEITVEGDGEPLGEGLLGAVLESRGYGPLDRRHQREASAWIHGHYCFHKKPFISITTLIGNPHILTSLEPP